MKSSIQQLTILLVVVGCGFALIATGHGAPPQDGKKPVQRAKRPKFSEKEVKSTYFSNLFNEALVGERPRLGIVANETNGNAGDSGATAETGGSGKDWSAIISADVIQNEIKALKLAADKNVTTPVKFAGGGYKVARRDFSMLAMLFAIIQDYPSDIRWKSDAAALRDTFSRSAGNSKTGSQQAYNEAKLRKQDLGDIVGGNSFAGTKAKEQANDWSVICDRSPVMERLQISIDSIKPAVSNESEFASQADLLRHEGALLAAMSEVLTLEGMEDAIEEDYSQYAVEMRDAGLSIVDAVNTESYEKAVQAVGVIDKSCSNCHDDWR